jgi:hypothetical protein
MKGCLALGRAVWVIGEEARSTFHAAWGNAREASNLNRTSSNHAIDSSVAGLDSLTAPIALRPRDRVGLDGKNRWSVYVRELGLRLPFDASLQYPQDSLL